MHLQAMGMEGHFNILCNKNAERTAVWFVLLLLLAFQSIAEVRDVVIMQTTDMHGVFEEEDTPQPGSWLRITTMVKRIRQREEGKCILVDCGDNAQGTLATALSRGMAGIIPLKTMKYDAWVPGNHELDYGVERFGELTEAVNDIVLCGNLYIKGKEPFPAWRMIERNGVKVAVIGMSASYAQHWLMADE